MRYRSVSSRYVTGLVAWMTLAACGEPSQVPQPEAESPGVAVQALATGPDFVVTSVTGPTSVKLFESMDLTVTVCNQGTLPGSADVELYLSADKVITPNGPSNPIFDTQVTWTRMSLDAGACNTQRLLGFASVDVEGTYYLGAAVDSWNQLPESNERNNIRRGKRIGVGNLPDLVVSSVAGPTSVQQQQPFSATVSVCNQGNQPGGGNLELFLSRDAVIVPPIPPSTSTDVPVGSISVEPLFPGQCRTELVQAWASVPDEGTWYVGAAVDPGNATVEFIEDNNTRAGKRVGVGQRPELVVTAVSGPASARPNSAITLTAKVCNQGTTPGGAPVEWYLSQDTVITPDGAGDLSLGSDLLPPLPPGQCVTRTFVSAVGSLQGPYYVGAVVDPANTTLEFFEDNNLRVSNRIGFGELPDFVVSSVTAPSGVLPGGTFSASVRVCNQGTEAGDSDVELYLSQDDTITLPVPPGGSDQDVPVGLGHVELAAGECRTVTLSGSVGTPDATYYVGAIVDPHGSNTELFEDNNTRAGSRIGVGYHPDFVVTDLTAPASVVPGQPFDVTVTVCNQGTEPHGTIVELYLSRDAVITAPPFPNPYADLRIGAVFSDLLEPGACQTLTLNVIPFNGPYQGAYYVGAAADPTREVDELFEDNNVRAGSRIGFGDRPDFVVTSVTGPRSARAFQPFNVTATVCNQGTQTGIAQGVELYLSPDSVITPGPPGSGPDVNVGFAPIGVLAPGQCQTVTVSASAGATEVPWVLGAVVDPGRMTAELFDDNNTRAGRRIDVLP